MTKRTYCLVVAALATALGFTALYYVAGYALASPRFNCEEVLVETRALGAEFSVEYEYRTCGLLYGGPFVVIELRKHYLLGLISWGRDIVEIERAPSSLRPKVDFSDGVILIEGVPSGYPYIAASDAFGLLIRVREE